MASGNWKDILREQQAQVERMEALDRELNEDNITSDIDKFLKKTTIGFKSRVSTNTGPTMEPRAAALDTNEPLEPPDYDQSSFKPPPAIGLQSDESKPPLSARRHGLSSPDSSTAPIAPEANARFQKAKAKVMSQQLEDAIEQRKHLSEQVADLQRQLNLEREENKKTKKRNQLLESENRRSSRKAPDINVAAVDSSEALNQEIAQLRKDLQTAERIAKQAEAFSKSKDAQLKRALESIAKLKSQAGEAQMQSQAENQSDVARMDLLESKIRTLEKQRSDLITGFHKQMRLIDVLKRQKVHIEAARLLSFTEEEFMKTLDWTV